MLWVILNLCRRKSILQQVISAKDLLWYCTLWETCKPYFSNKHARGDSKVMLIENDEMLLKNEEVAKEFNQYFGHRRATRNFQGRGGSAELGNFDKHFVKNTRKKRPRRVNFGVFSLRYSQNYILNRIFNPKMDTIRVFFRKIAPLFSIFKKGQGRPPL